MKSEIFNNSSSTETPGEHLNLSIFTGAGFFSYCLFKENYGSVIQVGYCEISKENFPGKTMAEVVDYLISDFRLSNRKYKNVDVAILNGDFTIMPNAFADKEHVKGMIAFSSGLSQPRNASSAVFNEICFSYAIDHNLRQLFEKHFKQVVVRHAGATAIELFFVNHSLKNCDLILNFHAGSFEIIASQDHKLSFYNIFSFESNEDILYYILFMMEQFQLNPVLVKLRIAGSLSAESDTVKALKRYIRHVEFAVSDKSVSSSFAGLQQVPDHYFFTLVNQHLCAS